MNTIIFQNIYNQYRHSMMQGLAKAVAEFTDPDFVWTNYIGQSFTREELLEQLMRGLVNYSKWTSDKVQTRVFGGQTAVLTAEDYLITRGADCDNAPVLLRVTVIFAKRETGWKMIGGHSSPIVREVV